VNILDPDFLHIYDDLPPLNYFKIENASVIYDIFPNGNKLYFVGPEQNWPNIELDCYFPESKQSSKYRTKQVFIDKLYMGECNIPVEEMNLWGNYLFNLSFESKKMKSLKMTLTKIILVSAEMKPNVHIVDSSAGTLVVAILDLTTWYRQELHEKKYSISICTAFLNESIYLR
jgi:hypothetical protein